MEHQFNWKSFLFSINCKSVVPVIGNDLSMLRLEKSFISNSDNYDAMVEAGQLVDEHLYINLYKYIAFRLWDKIGGKEAIPTPVTINNVVLKLHQINIPENDINNAVKNEITSLTDEQIMLEPYRNLVRISCFETFVTVNLDNFLERAFEAEGKRVNKSFNFSIPFPSIDLSYQKDPALANIYNLMGNIKGYNFALSDEQCLEYVYMLQNGFDTIAKDLFDSINRKNILLLGSSLPDWFMRFFIRILSNERFKNGVKAKYVACDGTLRDKELITFLENNDTKVIPIGLKKTDADGTTFYQNSIEFIGDMLEHMKSIQPQTNKVRYKELIFLSYSRDDKLLAERIRNEFEKNGLRVFFDEDSLKTGDAYNQVIRKHIKECVFFLPLISENAIKDKTRYVYEEEWKSAIVLNDFQGHPQIMPFIIDNTLPTDERIPKKIRDLNIEKISSFDNLDGTVRKFIKNNNLTPIT